MEGDNQYRISRENKWPLTKVAFSHPVKLNTISRNAVAELDLSELDDFVQSSVW
jgi:hypothetical protein